MSQKGLSVDKSMAALLEKAMKRKVQLNSIPRILTSRSFLEKLL
jgi:hypothetical protein